MIHNPVREAADVDRVIELESVDALHYVMETVRQTRADLPDHLPLIGFAGAPFTLASYAIEGGIEPQLPPHQDADVPRLGAWNALMESARPFGGGLSQCPNRRRGTGRATLR